jgi:hypothetical protein
MNRRSRCVEILQRYKSACNNPGFDLPNHSRFLTDCERNPPLAQLGKCIDLRRSFQHNCHDLWDEKVPGGHIYFLERLDDLEKECRRRFERAQSEMPATPSQPGRPPERPAISEPRRPAAVRTDGKSQGARFHLLTERGESSSDEVEEGRAATAVAAAVESAPKFDKRTTKRERKSRKRSEIMTHMSDLRSELSFEDAAIETIKGAVSETSLSFARKMLSEVFHLDNVKVENYVRLRKRFRVMTFLYGRRAGVDGDAGVVVEGHIREFNPELSDSRTGRVLTYMCESAKLNVSVSKFVAHLRELSDLDGPDAVSGEAFYEALEFDDHQRVSLFPRDASERFFPTSLEKEVLGLLQGKLMQDETNFKQTHGILRHRIGYLNGLWDPDEGGPVSWLCNIDETLGVLEAISRSERSIIEHQMGVTKEHAEESSEVLRMQNVFFRRMESSLLKRRDRIQDLQAFLRANSPSSAKREITELDLLLAQIERQIADDIPIMRRERADNDQVLRENAKIFARAETLSSSASSPGISLQTKLKVMRNRRLGLPV